MSCTLNLTAAWFLLLGSCLYYQFFRSHLTPHDVFLYGSLILLYLTSISCGMVIPIIMLIIKTSYTYKYHIFIICRLLDFLRFVQVVYIPLCFFINKGSRFSSKPVFVNVLFRGLILWLPSFSSRMFSNTFGLTRTDLAFETDLVLNSDEWAILLIKNLKITIVLLRSSFWGAKSHILAIRFINYRIIEFYDLTSIPSNSSLISISGSSNVRIFKLADSALYRSEYSWSYIILTCRFIIVSTKYINLWLALTFIAFVSIIVNFAFAFSMEFRHRWYFSSQLYIFPGGLSISISLRNFILLV